VATPSPFDCVFDCDDDDDGPGSVFRLCNFVTSPVGPCVIETGWVTDDEDVVGSPNLLLRTSVKGAEVDGSVYSVCGACGWELNE
jgi:hypothetical protein